MSLPDDFAASELFINRESSLLEFNERVLQQALEARGREAWIVARMNSLVEPRVIRALYAASRAGVQIDLIVRGTCCLRSGVAGVSHDIRLRSIVGRFFADDGRPELYLASADWMDRHFLRRVETCFPVISPSLYHRVEDELALYLADNVNARQLGENGRYRRIEPSGGEPLLSVRKRLMEGRDRIDVAAVMNPVRSAWSHAVLRVARRGRPPDPRTAYRLR